MLRCPPGTEAANSPCPAAKSVPRARGQGLKKALSITPRKGPANFDLYWRELLLVGDNYDMIFLQILQNQQGTYQFKKFLKHLSLWETLRFDLCQF